MSGKRNRRYHRFFEGYTEHTEIVNGKEKIVRVYTGKLFEQDCPKNRQIALRAGYTAGLILSALLFGCGVCMQSPASTNLIPVLPTMLSVFVYLQLLISLFYYYSLKPRTIYIQEEAHGGVLRCSKYLCILLALTFVLYLGVLVYYRSFAVGQLVCLALSVVPAALIYHIEKNCPYREYDAVSEKPEGTYIF